MENYRIKKITYSNGDTKYSIEQRINYKKFDWVNFRWIDRFEWSQVGGYYGYEHGIIRYFNTKGEAQSFIDNYLDRHVVNEEIVK